MKHAVSLNVGIYLNLEAWDRYYQSLLFGGGYYYLNQCLKGSSKKDRVIQAAYLKLYWYFLADF